MNNAPNISACTHKNCSSKGTNVAVRWYVRTCKERMQILCEAGTSSASKQIPIKCNILYRVQQWRTQRL